MDCKISEISVSDDGNIVAGQRSYRVSGDHWDAETRAWDLAASHAVDFRPRGATAEAVLTKVAVSPQGTYVASGVWKFPDDKRIIAVWSCRDFTEVARVALEADGQVCGMAFSPDDRYLLIGVSLIFFVPGTADVSDRQFPILVVDLSTGKVVRRLSGHSKGAFSLSVSPDSRFLASGSADTTVRIWDLAAGKEVQVLSGIHQGLPRVAWSKTGAMLVSAGSSMAKGSDSLVVLWSARDWSSLHRMANVDGGGKAVCWLADDSRVAVASKSGVRIWDAKTGELLQDLSLKFASSEPRLASRLGHAIDSGDGGTIEFFDLSSGEKVKTLDGGQAGGRRVESGPAARSKEPAGCGGATMLALLLTALAALFAL